MIKFSSLLEAIQKASETAARAVAEQNVRLLRAYFHGVKPEKGQGGNGGGNAERPLDHGIEELIPKMVSIKYPRETPHGPQSHDVYVPLISLAPITSMSLSDMTIELDLEIAEENGDIVVGFPTVKKTLMGRETTTALRPNAKVTITVSANERPNGMSAIIEGYDKAIRGQIPS